MKTRTLFSLALLASMSFLAGLLILPPTAEACPPGYHCPPGKTCYLGPGGGCEPNAAPKAGPKPAPKSPPKASPKPSVKPPPRTYEPTRERPPEVNPEEAKEKVKERLDKMLETPEPLPGEEPKQPPPRGGVTVPPPPGKGVDEYIKEITKEFRKRLCQADVKDGWLEPVQGVWQDDYTFADKPTKRLRRIRLDPLTYLAELAMVKGRDTLLFGIRGSQDPNSDPKRYVIAMTVRSNGATAVSVKMRFVLHKSAAGGPPGSGAVLYESTETVSVPLDPPCGTWQTVRVFLDASNGIPPGRAFKIASKTYRIDAELVRARSNKPTGLKMSVVGEAQRTFGPKVHFVPILLSDPPSRTIVLRLMLKASKLARTSRQFIPDFYPLRPGDFKTKLWPLRDMRAKVKSGFGEALYADIGARFGPKRQSQESKEKAIREHRRREFIREEVKRNLEAAGLQLGAGRIVGVFTDADFEFFDSSTQGRTPSGRPQIVSSILGHAVSQKVIFVRERVNYIIIAHELIHTIPYIWSTNQMLPECGRNYHGFRTSANGVSHGFRILHGGSENRQAMPQQLALMEYGNQEWIAQCTYWHLLKELKDGPPDPPVILVQGFLARREGGTAGKLFPLYQQMGVADLSGKSKGRWAIVLRNSKGDVLARYPFRPEWRLPHQKEERTLLSFAYRVPARPGVARIDLVGPSGLLDSKTYSAHPPKVAIARPRAGASVRPVDGKVRVAWKGTDADGEALLYSVLYSPDGGKNWVSEAFEIKEPAWEVRVDPKGKDHRVKVIATDGTRSAEAVAGFSIAK